MIATSNLKKSVLFWMFNLCYFSDSSFDQHFGDFIINHLSIVLMDFFIGICVLKVAENISVHKKPSCDGCFRQVYEPRHKSLNYLKLVSWTKPLAHSIEMASTVVGWWFISCINLVSRPALLISDLVCSIASHMQKCHEEYIPIVKEAFNEWNVSYSFTVKELLGIQLIMLESVRIE